MNKYKSVLEKTGEKGKLYMRAVICSSWGFSRKVKSIDLIAEALAESDYELMLNAERSYQGNGEFYLYKVEDDKETLVFSNNKDDAKTGAVIGGRPDTVSAKEIAALLIWTSYALSWRELSKKSQFLD